MSVQDPRESESRIHSTDAIQLATARNCLRRIERIARGLVLDDVADGHRSLLLEIETLAKAGQEQ
jgi:hypothetical protein